MSPSNTTCPEPRPTCMTSFILIHPTVWPQYTNVTDRQDRSDSIGRTVLQTVTKKSKEFFPSYNHKCTATFFMKHSVCRSFSGRHIEGEMNDNKVSTIILKVVITILSRYILLESCFLSYDILKFQRTGLFSGQPG